VLVFRDSWHLARFLLLFSTFAPFGTESEGIVMGIRPRTKASKKRRLRLKEEWRLKRKGIGSGKSKR